jgi:hypothetical protein
MQITLEISGGFASTPGLNAPYTIDTSAIDPARASELESIVRDAHFFELPARLNTTNPNAADYFAYAIKIEDGDRVHTVGLTDPVSDEGLTRLIDILRTMSPRS